jgi:hypothetical protein
MAPSPRVYRSPTSMLGGLAMIIHSKVGSDDLSVNLLRNPIERDVFVYLPPGYEESDRRYPTAYLLHAYG